MSQRIRDRVECADGEVAARIPRASPHRPAGLLVEVNDGVVLVEMAGRIDASTAAGWREELLEICTACAGTLIIDLSACTYFSADAVGLLRVAHLRCLDSGAQLRARAPHHAVRDWLKAAGIPRMPRQCSPAMPLGTGSGDVLMAAGEPA